MRTSASLFNRYVWFTTLIYDTAASLGFRNEWRIRVHSDRTKEIQINRKICHNCAFSIPQVLFRVWVWMAKWQLGVLNFHQITIHQIWSVEWPNDTILLNCFGWVNLLIQSLSNRHLDNHLFMRSCAELTSFLAQQFWFISYRSDWCVYWSIRLITAVWLLRFRWIHAEEWEV